MIWSKSTRRPEHSEGPHDGFTKKYNIDKQVYYEKKNKEMEQTVLEFSHFF